jgi:hypothetical protein
MLAVLTAKMQVQQMSERVAKAADTMPGKLTPAILHTSGSGLTLTGCALAAANHLCRSARLLRILVFMPATTSSGKKSLWIALAALLALHMLTLPFAAYLKLVDRGPTWLGLDDSARMVLNWAWIKHVNWGHDIIYTYGPLSFLSTKIGWGIPGFVFALFDAFVALNFFFLYRDLILGSRYKVLGALLAFVMTLAVPVFYGSGLAWVLMVLIYFWMYRNYVSPRPWQLAMLVLLITIAFYVKLNTGLFTILFLLGYLVLMLLAKRMSLLMAGACLAALILLILTGAYCFNVSLPAYVKGAVEVMKGYNDLLYLYEEHPVEEWQLLAIFWSMSIALGLGLIGRLRRKDWLRAFLILLSIAYLFLLKKQGLFRNDRQHIGEFFSYAPLIWLSGLCFITWPKRSPLIIGFAGVCTLACISAGINAQLSPPIGAALKARYTILYHYIREAAAYDPHQYANQPDKRILPPRVLQRISSATVDVFPWDANYALQNKLRYHPRPCFQTFQANSDYLQRVNYDFYVRQGPQFVIYDYDGIDNAYPFNDAPALNLFLAANYRVADTFRSNERWRILLQRLPEARPVQLIPAGSSEEVLDEPIPVQCSFMKLNVSYTGKGKLRAIWNRPAPLQIAYERPNGEWLHYKTSPELLKSGVYAGWLIRSNEDFARFIAHDTAGLERIRAIKLIGVPGHYKHTIEIEHFRIADERLRPFRSSENLPPVP